MNFFETLRNLNNFDIVRFAVLGLVCLGIFYVMFKIILNFLRELSKNKSNYEVEGPGGLKFTAKHSYVTDAMEKDKHGTVVIEPPKLPELQELPSAKVNEETGIILFTEFEFFTFLRNVIEYGVDVVCESSIKIACIKTFVSKCYSMAVNDELRKWVGNVVEMDGENLISILEVERAIVSGYHIRASNTGIYFDVNGKQYMFKKIPPIFMDRFDLWHENSHKILMDRIQTILSSAFYVSWKSKLMAILEAHYTTYLHYFRDLNIAAASLNGELDAYFQNERVKYEKLQQITVVEPGADKAVEVI
jgi:hypothetical protein